MGHPPRLIPRRAAASLVLVRHGESTWVAQGRFQGREDPPLSARGEQQAALVAERLAAPLQVPPLPVPPGRPVGLWHSPLSRARRTAEVVAARIGGIELRAVPDFSEIGQGAWEGRRHEEVVASDGAALEAWRREPTRFHAPGGEPLLEAASRVRRGVGELLAVVATGPPAEHAPSEPSAALAPPGRDGAARVHASPVPGYVVATGDDPWAIVVAHDGIFRLILLSLLELPYERFWNFPFVLCGITVVDIDDGRAALRAHNLADHLAPLAAADRAGAEEAKGDRRGAL